MSILILLFSQAVLLYPFSSLVSSILCRLRVAGSLCVAWWPVMSDRVWSGEVSGNSFSFYSLSWLIYIHHCLYYYYIIHCYYYSIPHGSWFIMAWFQTGMALACMAALASASAHISIVSSTRSVVIHVSCLRPAMTVSTCRSGWFWLFSSAP